MPTKPKKKKAPAKKPPAASPMPAASPSPGYERHRERMAERSREQTERGVDIGDIPAVVNPERREACRFDMRLAFETYWPERFAWPWSADHIDLIAKIQTVILDGGQIALALYRGGGKTTICEAAATWAVLYGHRKFCVTIGATGDAAKEILDSIQVDLETNDLLYEDFPEVCYPIRRLEGEARRCTRQTYHGERTRIEWSADGVVFADIPGTATGGAILHVVGMTGRIRGLKRGRQRPDLLLIDDPQTDESAISPIANAKRKRIIQRGALKLAGPKKKIACMMPCTIIAPGDMVDQFTDRKLHPEWNGERRQLVHSFPSNKELWEQYQELRGEGLRSGRGETESTDFYLANREAMDAGAVIAWPEFTKGKASAIQYVMDEFHDDPDGAAAELNNDPKKNDVPSEMRQLTEEDLKLKLNTIARRIVPRSMTKLTTFVDVHQEILYWATCAWSDRFGGALVDYGTFPEQRQAIFSVSKPNPTLSMMFPGKDLFARIYAGLEGLIPKLMGATYKQEDATGGLSSSLCLIDTGFQPDVVHDYISRSPLKSILHGSKGRGIGEHAKPMNDYRKDSGDWMGWNARIDAKTMGKGRILTYDTWAWKTFLAELILAPNGSASAFYLPGEKINEHPLLTLHLLSEYRAASSAESSGRRVEKWFLRPGEHENHWFDCVVGCAVGANRCNIESNPSGEAKRKRVRRYIDPAELQRQERERRTVAGS